MSQALSADDKSLLAAAPGWGSYLYNNFVLPSFSPSDWLNSGNTPNPGVVAQSPSLDYFNQFAPLLAQTKSEPAYPTSGSGVAGPTFPPQPLLRADTNPASPQSQQSYQVAGPSSFFPQPFYPNHTNPATIPSSSSSSSSAIPTSLLGGGFFQPSQQPYNELVSHDSQPPVLTRSPSPISSSQPQSPPLLAISEGQLFARGLKRRQSSLDSSHDFLDINSHDEHDHSHDEHDGEVPEGVERDGMIWGMPVDEYRSLSARERKRVRNRISARTFRAKRKEHLSSLEHTLAEKDRKIKLANDEAARLRREVAELRGKLAKYEKA